MRSVKGNRPGGLLPRSKCSAIAERARGFTLIELLIALALSAGLFAVLFSFFRFSSQAWESGEAKAVESSNTRLAQNFLRREISQTFAQRWKDGGSATSRIAFEGESQALRFVVPRPVNQKATGLTGVVFEIADDGGFSRKNTKLTVRRALLESDATDFSAVAGTEARTVLENLGEASFDFYGAEEDNKEYSWADSWNAKRRLPKLVRVKATDAKGNRLPELVVDLVMGEEAGCYNAAFQRDCPARK